MSILAPIVRPLALTPGWAKNELWRKARAVPRLDLRFADSKSLVDAYSGQSLVTFTRASSGTFVGSNGVLQTASTDVPRFDHNPTTGESLGLLVEEQRTNLIVQSEDLGTTWTTTGLLAFGSGSTLNATVAPDGATTADLVTENSSASEHRIETAAISWVANTTYTLTIFAKANGRTRMDFFGVGGGNFTGGRNASFNLSTGEVIATDGVVASIEARANGWYRVRMTFTASAAPSASQLFIRFLDNSNNFSYTGDGTSGIYLWGAQLEAGAFPTSYIPTTTAAVTRSADVASITGTNFSSWYNQTEGTVFTEQLVIGSRATDFTLARIDSGSNANRIQLATGSNATLFNPFIITSSSSQGLNIVSVSPIGATKLCFGFAANNSTAAANGTTSSTDTTVTIPTGVNRLLIGNASGSAYVNGTIKRLCFWPQCLANATLQTITQ